jgi:KDO2-lipid IV(A) lauroyltransferase
MLSIPYGETNSQPAASTGPGSLRGRALGRVIAASAALGAGIRAERAWQLAAVGGTLEWALRPRKRSLLATNLGHAMGRPPADRAVARAVRAQFVNQARRSADVLWAVARGEEVARRCRVEGRDELDRALERGRGAILAGPHMGGYDVVAAGMGELLAGLAVTVVVEDDWVSSAVAGLRRRAGVELELRTAAPRRSLQTLRRGGVVAVVADLAKPGMRTFAVRFLDGCVELPAGPAALARLSGSPVVPFCVLPIAPRAWRVALERAIDPPPRRQRAAEREVLQALADVWSGWISAAPELWEAVDPMPWVRSSGRGGPTDGRAPG